MSLIKICEDFGVQVRSCRPEQQKIMEQFSGFPFSSGTAIIQDDKPYILCDDSRPREEVRYIIAHELGHIILGHLSFRAEFGGYAPYMENATHGKSGSRIHRIWCGMIQRTRNPRNPNYADYGGRGITVCDEWLKFESFYLWAIANGYSAELTIDRIDNSQGYSPINCRWVDRKMQAENRRSSHMLEYNGEIKTLGEWASQLGMHRTTLYGRLKRYRGDVKKAFETPLDAEKKHHQKS